VGGSCGSALLRTTSVRISFGTVRIEVVVGDDKLSRWLKDLDVRRVAKARGPGVVGYVMHANYL
jgi:hypothetical protein